MSMFDYVHYKCPNCGELVEEQTKVDRCSFNHFVFGSIIDELPKIDEHDYDIEYEPPPFSVLYEAMTTGYKCDKCGYVAKFVFNLQ